MNRRLITMTFKYLDRVELIEREEVSPLVFINKGIEGIVIDETCPNYYLVKFDIYGLYWVDGAHLKLLKK
jgi:hypothetical protein